jgi:hypothetical protein
MLRCRTLGDGCARLPNWMHILFANEPEATPGTGLAADTVISCPRLT